MISPTIGRVVWYWPQEATLQPWPAIVAFVHSNTEVNLAVFDPNGGHLNQRNVFLFQAEEGQERPAGNFCEWMPYQKGQAAKAEELEKKLNQ